ncbi:ABC transporter permease [Micromonospora endolithica]|uniref:ABC transporter permease n=1 Tax=Micromonospora endolithica TaxID=230091 RepID=A0A3A9ZST5_9ACTN|nr:ABC transporter permease [Micromonospora endolithica]RKN51193.1 ABC transporter permease [Micromonospora endolithica]TWJ22403.1 peptide/nickel transport system permease protein [Micromonospora endolithica]
MIGYLVRRLAQLIPVLFVVSVVLFLLLRLLPGDPTTEILGQEASAADRAALRADLGLDTPLWRQFLDWIGGVLTGDLGRSWLTDEPVAGVIVDRLPATVELGLIALLLAVLIGIPAGVLAAVRRRTATDSALTGLGVLALSTPHFYLAALLILVFAIWLRVVPPSGYVPFTEDPAGNLVRMVLPAITVGSTVVAVVLRQTRGSLLAALGEDYIRTAEATGLRRRRIVTVYALRNALVPVVTVTALQIGALMSATVVTETIFTLPGMGTLIVNGIFSRDLPVVQGAVLVVVTFVLLVNLVTDLVYAWLDPRITY